METPFTWGRSASRIYGPYATTAAQFAVAAGLVAVAFRFWQLGDAPFFWGVALFLFLNLAGGLAGSFSFWRSTRTLDQGGAFLRAILDSIPASVSWVARDMTYRGANRALSEWLEVSEDSIIGRPLGFMSGEEGRLLQGLVERAFAGESSVAQAEVPLRRKGKVTPCLVTVRKFGNGEEAVVIAVDMSEQKAIQSKLELERNRAIFSAKMTTLGEMAAGIAHEINNPLGIILGKAQALKAQANAGVPVEAASVAEASQKIEETVQRIARVIRALREMAHDAESDPFVRTSLQPILDDVKDVMASRFEQRGVRFDFVKSPPVHLNCRPAQIAQVVLCMLENACEAAVLHKGKVSLTVEVRDAKALIKVEDDGQGIPPELHEKVFEPFFSTKGIGKGTGLSLGVSRSIANDHRGDLLLESSPGCTRFVLELPISQ